MQQHAHYNFHFLDYESWRWSLANGELLKDPGMATTIELVEASPTMHKPEEVSPIHCDNDLSS